MMMTGRSGWCCLIFSSSENPSMPGMRTSDNTTSGWPRSSASITPFALEKACDLHAGLGQRLFQHPTDRTIIIDDPDLIRFSHEPTLLARRRLAASPSGR